MKKIIFSLVLIFGVLFGGNVYGENMGKISLSSIKENINTFKGDKIYKIIKVKNLTNNDIKLDINIAGLDELLKLPNFKEKNPGNHIINNFIYINKNKLYLKPYEEKKIEYILDIPININETKYYGAIFFKLTENVKFKNVLGNDDSYESVTDYGSVIILNVTDRLNLLKYRLDELNSKLILTKYKNIISKFEKIILKLSNYKLEELNNRLSNLPDEIKNNTKYKDILDYLTFRTKLQILRKELLKNITYKKIDTKLENLSCDNIQEFLLKEYPNKYYIWNNCRVYGNNGIKFNLGISNGNYGRYYINLDKNIYGSFSLNKSVGFIDKSNFTKKFIEIKNIFNIEDNKIKEIDKYFDNLLK